MSEERITCKRMEEAQKGTARPKDRAAGGVATFSS